MATLKPKSRVSERQSRVSHLAIRGWTAGRKAILSSYFPPIFSPPLALALDFYDAKPSSRRRIRPSLRLLWGPSEVRNRRNGEIFASKFRAPRNLLTNGYDVVIEGGKEREKLSDSRTSPGITEHYHYRYRRCERGGRQCRFDSRLPRYTLADINFADLNLRRSGKTPLLTRGLRHYFFLDG